MGKQIEIADRLAEVAEAIREQTEYFREDDNKDVETKDEAPTKMSGDNVTYDEAAHWFAANPEFGRSANQIRRDQGLPEVPRIRVPEYIVEIMQETPHMFYQPRGARRNVFEQRANWPKPKCNLCNLVLGNPVHLIQMASLQED